jgi:hypothetical protein
MLLGSPLAEDEHEVNAADSIRKLYAVTPLQPPTYWVPVRNDHVEGVEPAAVFPVERAEHHPVDCRTGDGHAPAFACRADHGVDCCFVVDGVDLDAEDWVSTSVNHGCSLV